MKKGDVLAELPLTNKRTTTQLNDIFTPISGTLSQNLEVKTTKPLWKAGYWAHQNVRIKRHPMKIPDLSYK